MYCAAQAEDKANFGWLGSSFRARIRRMAIARLALSVSAWCVMLIVPELSPATAEQPNSYHGYFRLDREIQTLKKEFLDINRDLSLLEEELLYAPDQKLLVFVTVTRDSPFSPSHVKIVMDGEMLIHHLYTGGEINALRQGGVHRLYVGEVARGDHALQVYLTGTEIEGRDFQRKKTKNFFRRTGPTYVELRIGEKASTEGLEFSIDVW